MSGLHHDYHDNLYILLKGRKHFDLFSPAETQRMYTKGTLEYVHFNGLINYRESGRPSVINCWTLIVVSMKV